MPRIHVFESISTDGYFKSANGDVDWTHRLPSDPEFDAWVAGNASSGGALLFGRTTYEMMVSFWPTPAAAQQMPEVAKGMNSAKKYVLSRTLRGSSWNNTTVLPSIDDLKADVTILGSGSVVAQLSQRKLVAEYTFVRRSSSSDSSGRVVLTYEPK